MINVSINNSSVDVFRVFRLIGTSEELLRAADVSKRLDSSLSITRRALATLVETGYLQRHPHWGCYDTGFAARQLANMLLSRFPIRGFVLPSLRKLAFNVNATASLNVRLGWYSVRLASMEGGGSLFTHAMKLGDPKLLSASGAGRTILAFLEAEEVKRYRRFLNKLAPPGDSPSARERVQLKLDGIRAAGRCVDEYPERNAVVMSMPLRNPAGTAVASISLETAPSNIAGEGSKELLGALSEAIQHLEQKAIDTSQMLAGPFDHLDPDEIRFGLD